MIYFKVFLTVFGCYFLIESTESAQINTYVGQDGRSYYYSAVACESTSLVSYYLQNIRKSYTSRDEKQCCYLNVTRNSCCLSASGDCRCGPSVTCGVPTTTSTTTTTSTSQTTTPTTTPTTSTTTTTATTAKPQESLCSLQQRILNGAPLDNGCKYKGLANITLGNFTACHAVLTMATVNGTFKTTFLTTVSCKSIITAGNQTLCRIFTVNCYDFHLCLCHEKSKKDIDLMRVKDMVLMRVKDMDLMRVKDKDLMRVP
uniref:Uncharacterized protein n=1 Tax=Biomphalaria glabrata TaxID=6526 RepID=A0A2C9KFE9_BIOGL